jgi:hypothetical protein
MPKLNKMSDEIKALTSYDLPLSDVAVLYPVNTIFSIWATEGNILEKKLLPLYGGMSAYGIHADLLASYMLGEASLRQGKLWIKGEEYSSVIIPDNIIITKKTADFLTLLLEQDFPVYFGGEMPQFTMDGQELDFKAKYHFSIDGDVEKSLSELKTLKPSSICSQLEGAYVNVIPTQNNDEYFLSIVPVVPKTKIKGSVVCMGVEVEILPTSTLAIYKVNKNGSSSLVYHYQ